MLDVQDMVPELSCGSLLIHGMGRRQCAEGGQSAPAGLSGTGNTRVVEVIVAQGWDLVWAEVG